MTPSAAGSATGQAMLGARRRRARLLALAWLAVAPRFAVASEQVAEGRAGAGGRASGALPNIVLIFVDDLGYGNLGAYGQELIATPRLDRMAAEGLVLTDFYAGDTWCPASRNSLVAGQHTGHTQLRGAGVLAEDSAPAPLYLPRFLSAAGYATGMFGKWGLGAYFPPADIGAMATGGRPSELGFDEFLGQLSHRDAHTFTLPPYPQQPGDLRIHPKLWTIVETATVEDPELEVPFIHERVWLAALDFIDRHRGQPFFLYLPWALPHAEYYLPDDDDAWIPYLDPNGDSLFPETPFPGNAIFRRPVPAPKAAFAAMVTRLDADVGRLLDALEDAGLAGDTLVIFASDNGPAADGGFESPEFFASAGGLRDFKLSVYEGGIRVPMVAHWPGTVAPGVSDLPMALWDLLPTLLGLAGADRAPGLDGLSMVPLLAGDVGGQPRHDELSPLYWETFNTLYRSQAARLGRWKAVRPVIDGPRDRVELYDLLLDPQESQDLSALPARCDVLLELVAVINAAHVDPPDNPGGQFTVPPLDLVCPGLFGDGFESGDASAWSDIQP